MNQRGLNASAPAFTPRTSMPALRRSGATHTTPTKMPTARVPREAMHAAAKKIADNHRARDKAAARNGYVRRHSQKMNKRNAARIALSPGGDAEKENRPEGNAQKGLSKSLSSVTADERPIRQSLSMASIASVGIEPRSPPNSKPVGGTPSRASGAASSISSEASDAALSFASGVSSGIVSGPGSGITSGTSSTTSAAFSVGSSGTSSTTSVAFSVGTPAPAPSVTPSEPLSVPSAPSPPLPELLTGSVPTVAASGLPPTSNVLSRLPSCSVDIHATPRTSAVSNSGSSGPPPTTGGPLTVAATTTMSAGKWCEKCAGVGLHVAALLTELSKQPRVDVISRPTAGAGGSGSLASKGGGWKRRMSQTIIGDRGAAKAAAEAQRLQQQVDVLTATIALLYEKLQAADSVGPAVEAAYNRCMSHI